MMSKLTSLAQSEARRKNPRLFPCDQCDASYTTNQKLRFHKMRIHENAKFECPHCTKILSTPDTLRKRLSKLK